MESTWYWDILARELARNGKRHLALKAPLEIRNDTRRNLHRDLAGFQAFAILEDGANSFRDSCVDIFARFIHTPGQNSIAWNQDEMMIVIAAAHYLAEHYAGEPDLGRRLEQIGSESVEPTGPLIALCRGWPQASVLHHIWNQSPDNAGYNCYPATAWLVGLKASPRQFVDYILSLPQSIQTDRFWSRRVETLRAVQDRLSRDEEAQALLLEAIKSASSLDTVNRRHSPQLPAVAYDIMSGRERPLEFSLLECCLVR